ncbi:MAG: cytochrome c biogenesis protein CcsA [Bacteroidia bacterium]
MGLLGAIPEREILYETIRNLYFHVPMWFSMVAMFGTSVFFSIKYLSTSNSRFDDWAVEFANIGILFGFLGLTTGMIWAQFTWGAWWSFDPKQNGAAITLLIYLAFMVLRNSITDTKSRARVSSVYNVFAFAAMIPLIFILPRMSESLHPGADGNPGFNTYDLDGRMRIVFYPAVIGWIMLGMWLTELRYRTRRLKEKLYENRI